MAKAIFSGVMESKCICTGKNCRMSPFTFSLAPPLPRGIQMREDEIEIQVPSDFFVLSEPPRP